jgi:steroid delta-isomerase-like uncharacterized protein
MIERNKEIARRWLLEFWNGDLSMAHELHAPDYTRHDSPFPINDPDAYVQYIQIIRTPCPDMTFNLEDMVAEDDKVLIRWTATMTHQGELMGIPATGKKISNRGMDLLHFKDGKIIESWGLPDVFGIFLQIGRFPEIDGLVKSLKIANFKI